jgi:hypothetical protein
MMKRARPCLAGAAALALALVVANVPAPATAAPGDDAPKRNLDSPYANTAIGAVLDANDGKVPASGQELVAALAKLGNFVQLPISFSAVALDSGLTHPRVVLTMRPSTIQEFETVFIPDNKPQPKNPGGFGGGFGGWGGGWGGGVSGTTKQVPLPLKHINTTSTNRTQLQGRLFLAANTEIGNEGLRVRTVEFISWNSRKLKFDFGVIEGMHTPTPELKILDGTRCFSCHKGRGPIIGAAPWSNTMHNDVVRNTALVTLSRPVKLPNGTEIRIDGTDGLVFKDPHAMEVDVAVQLGGELLRDRAIFKRLAETPETRRALVLLFETIVVCGSLEKNDKVIRGNIDALVPARLGRDARNAKLNGAPSALRDFSPAGPVTREFRTWSGPNGAKNQVTLYDESRAQGRTRLPSEFLPSNPKAFVPAQVKTTQPSEFMNAIRLAQTMGLSEKDRAFLADVIEEAVERLDNPALTLDTVSNMIFAGPAFADVLTTGNLPDRDDFKDRFVAGIMDVFKKQNRDDKFWQERETYASAPKFDPSAKEEKEIAALPSHACLGCHDVAGLRKSFNPIPQLAFDPFDATARAEWLKSNDRKSKVEVLDRMLKRLGTDRDMPPEDSVEAELYRQKNPTGLVAVKNWLDVELKKVK